MPIGDQKPVYKCIQVTQEQQWQDCFSKQEKAHLVQSWHYGEAKSLAEGWQPERLIFYKDEKVIALVQVLKKCIGGIWTVVRINRGPLWCKIDCFTEADQNYVLTSLKKKYAWYKRCVILIAPNLIATEQNQKTLKKNYFFPFKKILYGTIFLDLTLETEALRKALRSNWRGQLTKSEKTGLLCQITNPQTELSSFFLEYESLQKKKSFSGLSVNLLKQLFLQQTGSSFQCLLFKAIYADAVIGGVLIVRHGTTCTYLVGWLDRDKAKGTNATNFLLWQAIVEMKQQGCQYFDLGGISETAEELASITSFKRGLGGEECWWLGEHIAL